MPFLQLAHLYPFILCITFIFNRLDSTHPGTALTEKQQQTSTALTRNEKQSRASSAAQDGAKLPILVRDAAPPLPR
jgi:hypothetical protein